MKYIPLFGKKKLLLAFECGVIIGETARKQNIELNRELMERAEKVIIKHFTNNSTSKVACEMVPVILSIFEVKEKDEQN